jgi:hypothetical protein
MCVIPILESIYGSARPLLIDLEVGESSRRLERSVSNEHGGHPVKLEGMRALGTVLSTAL